MHARMYYVGFQKFNVPNHPHASRSDNHPVSSTHDQATLSYTPPYPKKWNVCQRSHMFVADPSTCFGRFRRSWKHLEMLSRCQLCKGSNHTFPTSTSDVETWGSAECPRTGSNSTLIRGFSCSLRHSRALSLWSCPGIFRPVQCGLLRFKLPASNLHRAAP
ncbi:hypothetical protein OF83DRAFT_707312 [Amylostereum chailletii]|nr:hypothetical protein OF83DRAFT_707312 [Amylostereum chailletii]